MLDCKKVKEELVFLVADNEMEQELTIEFYHHVQHCPECAFRARQARRLLALLRGFGPRPAPRRLRVRILSALPHRRRGPV